MDVKSEITLMDLTGSELDKFIVQHLPVVALTRDYPEGISYHRMHAAARNRLYGECETWLIANLGRPFMQGTDRTTGLKRINLQGQWQRHRARSFLLTRNAAIYTKLGSNLFDVVGDFITLNQISG